MSSFVIYFVVILIFFVFDSLNFSTLEGYCPFVISHRQHLLPRMVEAVWPVLHWFKRIKQNSTLLSNTKV